MAIRLSQAPIFQLNQAWYEQTGPAAWGEDRIPSYATSNAGSARACADVIATFSREVGAPVSIVEVGCGSGRFGFLLALELQDLLDDGDWTLLLTDAAPSLVAALREHPAFERWRASGQVRFEVLDAGSGSDVVPAGPVVVVCNYLFDSLPQDVFARDGEQLIEVHFDGGNHPNPAPLVPYGEGSLDAIVQSRAAALPGTDPFWLPVGGLRLLDALAEGREHTLAIVADRGWVRDADVTRAIPVFDAHDGAVSLMVDLGAVAAWGELGGWSVLPEARPTMVHTMAACRSPLELRDTRRRAVERFDVLAPFDAVFAFSSAISIAPSLTLSIALANLRLARWDPLALSALSEAFLAPFENEPAEYHLALEQALDRVLERSYALPGAESTEVLVARVFLAQGRADRAEALLSAHLDGDETEAQPWLDLALCRRSLGDRTGALAAVERVLEIDPFHESGRALRRRLEAP